MERSTSLLVLTAMLLILGLPGMALSEVYKYVDKNGVTTFQNGPPPKGVKAQTVDATPNFGEGEGAFVASPVTQTQKAKTPQVELFVTAWCPYCKKAASFFRSNNIPFVEYDIEKSPAAARRKKELDGRGGVPFAIVNGQKISGYSPDAYRAALGRK